MQDYHTDGQAADAISADSPFKMGDAPRLLGIPKSECPDIWTQSWSNCEGEGDVVGVVAPLAEWRRLFSTESRLSRSVCRSGCIRTEEWKKTGEGQVEVERRKVRSEGTAHHG